jgi:transcriptional regulator with XRE-family HTH domain
MEFFFKKSTFNRKILLLIKFYILLLQKKMTEKEKTEKVIRKIAAIRTKKGYTYENMANELSITPAAYRKIETGETKLTVERLFRISAILNALLPELLEIGNDVLQQTNNENATGYQQKIENFYQDNKEVYEKLLQSKDEQITLLKSLLDNHICFP